VLGDELEELGEVRRDTGKLEVVVSLDESRDPFAQQRVVLRQDDPDHVHRGRA